MRVCVTAEKQEVTLVLNNHDDVTTIINNHVQQRHARFFIAALNSSLAPHVVKCLNKGIEVGMNWGKQQSFALINSDTNT